MPKNPEFDRTISNVDRINEAVISARSIEELTQILSLNRDVFINEKVLNENGEMVNYTYSMEKLIRIIELVVTKSLEKKQIIDLDTIPRGEIRKKVLELLEEKIK